MKQLVFIYSISCPLTGAVKYIGKTVDPKTRFRKHRTAKKQSATSKWIFSLKEKGLSPIFKIIDEVLNDKWEETERYYIKLYRSLGFTLLNHTDGGEGGNTMGGRNLTKEQSLKISISKKGKPNPSTAKYNALLKSHKINQYTKEGLLISAYNSIREAERITGICFASIQRNITGHPKNSHAGGFIFKRAS